MPITFGMLERLRWAWWDTIDLPAGSQFFQRCLFNFVSGRDPGKTNMWYAGHLGENRFIVRRIELQNIYATPQDLARFKRSALIELFIACKCYWQGTPSRLILEDNLQKIFRRLEKGKKKIVADLLSKALEDGCISFGDQEQCEIAPFMNFSVQVSPTSPFTVENDFSIRVVLDGILYRPIQ